MNTIIDEFTKDKIINAANMVDVISDFVTLKKKGSQQVGECPLCGGNLSVSPGKKIFKCFSCNQGGNSAISYLINFQKKEYVDALKYCADKYGILISEPGPRRNGRSKKKHTEKSFRDKQLYDSGLSDADVKAITYDDDDHKTKHEVQVFESGTLDQYHRIDSSGDDMIIWYYDLNGKQVKYQKKNSSKMFPFFRVRFQFPHLNKDKYGRPTKYKSPYGSGTHIYIPEAIRKLYKHKRKIKRLFLQEGEKKAEKACKHGIISVGVGGIQNIGRNGKLPQELQLIIKICEVEEVVFMLDSDWSDLSQDIKSGDRADLRPLNFFYAVKNFKEYFKSFANMGIYLDIYFGHILENDKGDKGIDDYLSGTLKGKQGALNEDIEYAINEKDGKGEHVQIHKLSELTDPRIKQIWDLDSAENFANRHKDILINIPEFGFGPNKWRFNKEGKFESAQPIENFEKYWDEESREDRSGKTKRTSQFNNLKCYNFLNNRGYGRIKLPDGKEYLCCIDNMVVELVDAALIKDYVMQFTIEIAPEHVINMMYRNVKYYLGADSLSNLAKVYPEFHKNDQDTQFMFFKDKVWKITDSEIKESEISDMQNYVWRDKIKDFSATRLDSKLLQIKKFDNKQSSGGLESSYKEYFAFEMSEKGKQCHFLQFLKNTSNFHWRKTKDGDKLTFQETVENGMHFIAKITAFGYLIHQYYDSANTKAVIGMDGKLSEVGASHGGSGKSLFGEAVGHIVSQAYIPAKNKRLTEDNFLMEGVSDKTDNIYLDDTRKNFDFEHFFPMMTGNIQVNKKGIGRFIIPKDQTPKFYIATNHAIDGETDSYERRQAFLSFSDFYNLLHRPLDDFGIRLFEEWDSDQWNLFYNFAAECIQAYLTFGIVEPPTDDLKMRRLRQKMGEELLSWADTYYMVDKDGTALHLNEREPRWDVYESFLREYPQFRKFLTANKFKEKIEAFCKYKGYRFNPHLYDSNGKPLQFDKKNKPIKHDKSGGVEYFTIGNDKFNESSSNHV